MSPTFAMTPVAAAQTLVCNAQWVSPVKSETPLHSYQCVPNMGTSHGTRQALSE